MIREIDGGGSSHISQNSVIAHFGVGNPSIIDKITVYWTGGNKQSLLNVKANQLLTITEIPRKKANTLIIYLLVGLFIILSGLLLWKKKFFKK
jgi:enediyne biosynthesis protein E4